MVSDAVGAKVLGKRSQGTLSTVSPIGCVENKAKSRSTGSPQASGADELTRTHRRGV